MANPNKNSVRTWGMEVARYCRMPSAALCLALGASMLVGCEADAGTSPPGVDVVVVTYHGRDLNCVENPAPYGQETYDCDFVHYYADPRYVAPASLPRIPDGELSERTVQYNGKTLVCLQYSLPYGSEGETCDYPAYYKSHK